MVSYKFFIRGVVQGVGFRPFIYNACKKAGLKGYVQNTGEGVIVEVDDKEKLIRILKDAPKLARVDSFNVELTSNTYNDFSIRESKGEGFAEIPPDLYLCEDCYEELNNPSNRRYKYFFNTCTNCGPRFSITRKIPYDRETTTMNEFKMCRKCREEYTNPENRRYHAQTIACFDCGPRLRLFAHGKEVKKKAELDYIREAAELIKKGEIVAIKGIGGFHLACRISDDAVRNLRSINRRKHKPFAVMCRDTEMAERIAYVSEAEKRILESVQRPILILKKKKLLREVSELDTVGIMLPYTALHYLLFDFINEPIIMTSSNISDEPITRSDEEQFVKNVLTNDRVIENSIDDSLAKVIQNRVFLIRRSRGFVPASITIKFGEKTRSKKQVLALGAEMNSAFCIYKNGRAILSQYLGTTSNQSAFENYKRTVEKFLRFTNTKPDLLICDLHPTYNTSLFGEFLSEKLKVPLVRVQHHKAHSYSAAAEHNLTDFVGIACDGLGFGEDNTIWGGEIFYKNKRIGHLEPQLQLGGDSAAVYPAKMLFSILSKFLTKEERDKHMKGKFSAKELEIMQKQLDEKFNCPLTTSCGRILDAASSLLGFCDKRTYEGRPAMMLEANSTKPYDLEPVIKGNVLMTTPIFEFLTSNIDKDKKRLAATVQQYLAEGLYEIASKKGKPIVFSGGCAYNRIMSSFMIRKGVYTNEKVPAGDGGISFGQVSYYLANST
ncbi:carbamoyltransferase HypF [Candidatus Woesearchaeota archaeon]|nr:MAG: carbamoyltransferase HypF [Candidatus Woesearchaeota archaeon]